MLCLLNHFDKFSFFPLFHNINPLMPDIYFDCLFALQARFWMQVVDELRRGVRLKKISSDHTPTEYELTPYEILMEDIRSR